MNENLNTNSELLNVNQAAEFLGVNVGTIRRWARAKTLTGINVGVRGDWRFTKYDLLKMTKANNNPKSDSLRIVGIGASAGGLEAVTQLLQSLPTNLGMSFVLVQHLDPTHESILAELLSKTTHMPVEEAKDNTQVEADHVYVIPYNKDMTVNGEILKLTNRNPSDKHHMPIDHFFQSLAESQKEKAVGIILSGTATDGTQGFQAIKNNGGVTIAQDKSAKYQGMPKAAISAGCVDFVLSPTEIAKEITRISSTTDRQMNDDKDELFRVLFLLRKNFGIDFRHYKGATIKRRVRRRMLLHKLNTFKDYSEYLKTDDKEIESLRDDLLINVTSFFREPLTFQFLLDTVFPRLVKNRSSKDAIRIWVPGCATGEEVYSLAISIFEFLTGNSLNIPIQIFGTDLSKQAIEKARTGAYSQDELDNISASRLERFFEKKDGDYQVIKSIREMCIFAPHNVFGDPPFSRLDLISCCNLLIYLDLNLQNKVLRAFHFALKPESFLVLGKSETINSAPELFSQIDKKVKIFTKKVTAAKSVLDLDTFVSQMDKQEHGRIDMFTDTSVDSADIQKEADKILLNHYTPASVIVDKDLEIIQFRGSTGIFLEPSPGKASFNLIKMAKEGLGFELRSAISKVRKDKKAYKKENILIKHNEQTQRITIEVIPLKSLSPGIHFLVLFEETSKTSTTDALPGEINQIRSKPGVKDKRIKELEEELSQIREDMRAVTEEQEATNEELQTTSEEILSSNEELQSINEELETSKEELESTNEELNTLNDELQNRNEQLVEARDYAEAIIRTVQVPLLILDSDLRVKTANRYFYQMFQVNENDTIGKFIYDLGNGQWDIAALKKLLNEILPKDNYFDSYEIEHVLPSIGKKNMLLNGRRFYKDGNNILLTIEDITSRRDIEKQKDLFIGIASHELKTPITTMKGYAQMLGKRLSRSKEDKNNYLIDNINNQIDRLVNLINDLLNTSKIQAGKLLLEKQKFDLDVLVTKTISDIKQLHDSHQIIKEGKINDLVFADKNRIEQTLVNLITNAIKYSPNANKVIVKLTSDKKWVTVSVQDFGVGIDKSDQTKIFERFYRSSKKEDENISGFGLGLFIASEIIKEHRGKIWVESEKGKGSTFYFTLPL